MWARLTYAITQLKLDLDEVGEVRRWLFEERICRERREIVACLEAGFWWHGHWYIDRVLAAARLRGRIENATRQLQEAIDAGANWR